MALKSWWKLDNDLVDFVGGHNGALIGAGSQTYRWGRVGSLQNGAFRNSGATNIEVANHADFNTNVRTITFWYKRLSHSATTNVFSRVGPGVVGFQFYHDNNGALRLQDLDKDGYQNISGPPLADGVWCHIGIVHTAANHKLLYINGVQYADAVSNAKTQGNAFHILAGTSSGEPTPGTIDDVRWYDSDESSNIAAIYASDVSTPAIYELRASGGDYTTFNSMALILQSHAWPLLADISVYAQGGQVFGIDDGSSNTRITPITVTGAGKTLWITTDPAEIATPATILGLIRTNDAFGGNLKLKISKLKLQFSAINNTFVYGSLDNSGGNLWVEDCFIARKCDESAWGGFVRNANGAAGSWVKGCTICLTFNTFTSNDYGVDSSKESSVAYHNNVFLFYYAGAMRFSCNSSVANKNNTFFNFGPGGTSGGSGSTWDNSVSATNPNLTTSAMVTAYNESPATILARNAHLTASSAACRDNADPATATATDIEGVTRG